MGRTDLLAWLLSAAGCGGLLWAWWAYRRAYRAALLPHPNGSHPNGSHPDSSPPNPFIYYADTEDGWRLALHRYPPNEGRPAELPIVLCHGLSANRFNLDFDAKRSLAQYLSSRGYDVWVLELRGTGLSHAVRRSALLGSTFDDYWRYDLPAAFALVLRTTRAPKLNVVGHSMGGMLMYCGLPQGLSRFVHAVVALGSPATFRFQRYLRLYAPLLWLTAVVPRRWQRAMLQAFAPLLQRWMLPFTAVLSRYAQIDLLVHRQMLMNGVETPPAGVTRQFLSWVWRASSLRSTDGFDFDQTLGAITQPLLLVAGESDLLAPPASVRHAFMRVSSEEREWVVCSSENGFSHDYGHVDLVLSDAAVREIFPIVEGFLWKQRHGEIVELQRKRA